MPPGKRRLVTCLFVAWLASLLATVFTFALDLLDFTPVVFAAIFVCLTLCGVWVRFATEWGKPPPPLPSRLFTEPQEARIASDPERTP